MPSIAVARAFAVLLDDGRRFSYTPGLHKDVPQEVATHWWTKLFLSPDGEAPADTETVVPDAGGVSFLVQAKAAAEDAAERLRAELRRVTDAWNETDIALRRALAQIESGKAPDQDMLAEDQQRTALDHVTAERDALQVRVNELEAGAQAATTKVQHLTEEVSGTPANEIEPDHQDGNFTIRKRGKYFQIAKTTDTSVEVVADKLLNRAEAETKLTELKSV